MRRTVSWIRRRPAMCGYSASRLGRMAGEEADSVELLEREQAGAQAVIDIVVVVGDLVGQIADLRFQRGRRPSRKRRPSSPSSRAFAGEQCLRMPSRVSNIRLRPSKAP